MTATHQDAIAPVRADPVVGALLVRRVCGLPADAVDVLAAPETSAELRAGRICREVADRLADMVADDLYALVPSIASDKPASRAALALRRDVHNGRWRAATAAKAVRIGALLAPPAAERLASWADAMRRAQEHRAAAAATLPVETDRAGAAMLARLRSPDVAAGLALASPEFTKTLLAQAAQADMHSRFGRSATAYLTRIAAKTSPFSTLTTIGMTGLGEPISGRAGRAVSSGRALAIALLLAFLRDPDGTRLLDVQANQDIRPLDGRLVAMLAHYAARDGFCFRYDELADCDAYRWLLGALPQRAARLVEMDIPDVGPMLRSRLVEMGLLRPLLPWSASSPLVFGALADLLRARATARLAPLVDAAEELARCETRLVDSVDAESRIAAVQGGKAAVRSAFGALDQPAPNWLDAVPPFHEIVADPAAAEPAPTSVADDVAAAARWLGPRTIPDPRYDRLVACFVKRYGIGGTCTDPVDFLYAADPIVQSGVALTPTGSRPLRGSGTLGAATQTIFFQLATGVFDQPRLVINMVHSGAAGPVARWAPLHDRLNPFLRDWLSAKHPGCRVYQFSAYPDWADLQRPALDSMPRLRCPGDLPDRGVAADLSQFLLSHDAGSGTLQAYDRDGRPAAFSYLGTVPAHLLAGPPALLNLISDPWLTIVDTAGTAALQPRVERGRVVWQRARWRLPAAEMPRPEPLQEPVDFLAEVESWRARHHLPAEIYLRSAGAKPQWLGFDHPHAIYAALRQIGADAGEVELVEALPAHDEHWSEAGQSAVATEYVAMVRHG